MIVNALVLISFKDASMQACLACRTALALDVEWTGRDQRSPFAGNQSSDHPVQYALRLALNIPVTAYTFSSIQRFVYGGSSISRITKL